MTTLTKAQIEAMLAGATRGNWREFGKASGYVITEGDPEVGSCLICVTGNFQDEDLVPFNADRWNADNRLIAAAPDLARTAIALHDRVAELEGALAAAVEYMAFRANEGSQPFPLERCKATLERTTP